MRNIPFSLLLFVVSCVPLASARAQPFSYPVEVCDLAPASTDERSAPLSDASSDPALVPGCVAATPYPGQAYRNAGHAAPAYSGPIYRTPNPVPYYLPVYPQAAYPAAYPPVVYPPISYPLPGFSGRVYGVPRYQPQPRHHHPLPIIVVPRHRGYGHHEHRHSPHSRHGRY